AFAKKGSPPPDPSSGEPIVEYDDNPEEIDFVGVAATTNGLKLLKSMEIPLLEQGLIGGMSGVVLGEARRMGLNMFSILVEADPRFPDARAASALIEKLDNLLSVVDLDTAPLIEEAERIEDQIKSMLEHQLQAQESGKNSTPNSMLYG
ncbi:MAG TPA: PAC2 family protein, partial [Candidatus Poseidoniaceae archaeon]|nr:PAC2 family protein [Candidatus Poseidoniaceae archaeon]